MKSLYAILLIPAILGVGCSVAPNATYSDQKIDKKSAINMASKELDLSGRGLTAIPMDVFSQTNLVKLDLSKNRLTNAPQSQIGQLKDLVFLDLSNNQLTGLPAEIGQLKNLEVLNVSNNQLTGLPLEIGNLTQLRILDISGNTYSQQDLAQIAEKLQHTDIRK